MKKRRNWIFSIITGVTSGVIPGIIVAIIVSFWLNPTISIIQEQNDFVKAVFSF